MLTTSALLFFFDFVHAGGPTGQSIRFRRDNQLYPRAATGSAQEYIAISTSRVGSVVQCLTRNGETMVELQKCDKLDLADPNRLFTFVPVKAYLNGKLIKSSTYALRSAVDGHCVDFTPMANRMFFNLTKCSDVVGHYWFFSWVAASQKVGRFPVPKYSAISSPAAGFRGNISDSKCYFANNLGGISLGRCNDTQKFTWFGHSTFKMPFITQVKQENEKPCDSNPFKCDTTTKDITVFRPDNGKVAKDSSPLSGIFLPENYSVIFSLIPDGANAGTSNIFKFHTGNFFEAATAFTVSFEAGSTRLKIIVGSTTNTKSQIILRNELPLKEKTDVIVAVFGTQLLVYLNGTLDSYTTISPRRGQLTYFYTSDPWNTPADGFISAIKVHRLYGTPTNQPAVTKIDKSSISKGMSSTSLRIPQTYSIKFAFSPSTINRNILRITDDPSLPYDRNMPAIRFTKHSIILKVSTKNTPSGEIITSKRILALNSVYNVEVKLTATLVNLFIDGNRETFTLNSPLYQDPDGEGFLIISNHHSIGSVTVHRL